MTAVEVPAGEMERETRKPDEAPDAAQHVGARAGAYGRAILILRSIRDFLADRGQRVRDSNPFTYRPDSIQQVWERTVRGGWIPGDHSGWVESPGYLFGFLVAIPATVLGVPTLYITQRMGRSVVFTIFCACLFWAGVAWLVWRPLWFAGHALLVVVGLMGGGS